MKNNNTEKAFDWYIKIIDYGIRVTIVFTIIGILLEGQGLNGELYRAFTFGEYSNIEYTFDIQFFGFITMFLIFGVIGLHFLNTMTDKLISFNKYIKVIKYVNLLLRIGIWTWIIGMFLSYIYIVVLFFNPLLDLNRL